MTAVAILWHMDTPNPDRVKAAQRGTGFERFFVRLDEEARDPDYPALSFMDVHPEYSCGAEEDDGGSDTSRRTAASEAAPQHYEFDVRSRRLRSLCLHQVIAVHPVGTPLHHSVVGQFFSSFNASLQRLQSGQAGWQGWHLLQAPSLTMSSLMSTVGFLNHPSFSSIQVREQLEETDWRARADYWLEEEHYQAVQAAGKRPAEEPYVAQEAQLAARARALQDDARSSLLPDAWCLRDALACMCIRPYAEAEGECDVLTCAFVNAPVCAREPERRGTRAAEDRSTSLCVGT